MSEKHIGALRSFGEEIKTQNCNIYNIKRVMIRTQIYIIFYHNLINELFSEENKVPRTLFGARKVAGSATY